MAERRMFTKNITESDAFLDLSLSAQALYFHLSMSADDDGFVNNTRKIQRMLGCTDEDMSALISQGFVISFDSGVAVIVHWKQHNQIRKDRYRPTVYKKEMSMLSVNEDESNYVMSPDGCQVVDERLSDGCQVVDERLSDGCHMVDERLPDGCQVVDERLSDGCQMVAAGKDSIGKVSTVKESEGKSSSVKTRQDELTALPSERLPEADETRCVVSGIKRDIPGEADSLVSFYSKISGDHPATVSAEERQLIERKLAEFTPDELREIIVSKIKEFRSTGRGFLVSVESILNAV